MLDDYRQLIVFVYCCMLIVSHRTQGAQEVARFASLRRPLRDRKVEGGEVAPLRPPRPASRPRRGPGLS